MIGKCEDVETKNIIMLGGETSNNLDYKPATQQNHRAPGSLKDTAKGLTHV